eukprot:11079369-Heterocapsa_arctica.AAC.1
MDLYRGRRDADGVSVAAILGQEHHAFGDAWVDLQHRARRGGWKLQGAQAVRCDSGRGSAGTCVAASANVGLSQAAGCPFDCSPEGSEGRLSAAWLEGVLRGGVMVMSVYLWHTEGLTERNIGILNAAGEAAARFGGPWLLAGDFNMTPSELQQAQGWLERIGGVIVAPQLTTCRTSLGGRTIDFCVVDRRIENAVHSVWADLGCTASPHTAVVVRLRAKATREMARRLRKPISFPAERPVACMREPVAPSAPVMGTLRRAQVSPGPSGTDRAERGASPGPSEAKNNFEGCSSDSAAPPA